MMTAVCQFPTVLAGILTAAVEIYFVETWHANIGFVCFFLSFSVLINLADFYSWQYISSITFAVQNTFTLVLNPI